MAAVDFRPVARRALAAGLVSVLALGATACGSKSKDKTSSSTAATTSVPAGLPSHILDTKTVELAIRDTVKAKNGEHVKVLCPKVVPQQKGHSFQCVARNKKIGHVTFVVHQTDDQGHVTYGPK